MNGDPNLTKDKLLSFFERLGASARTSGTCFITGGGSALLLGWRETTIDVEELLAHAESIRPEIKRYPAVDEESFVRRLKEFLGGLKDV
jgi:hypothetical protein